MDLNRYIDLHCERTQPGFFEEPLNVLSALLFFVAAYYLWRELKKQKTQPIMLRFLVVMVAVIGIGSITYHTTARMWAAMFADGLPIAVTAVTFLYLATKHVLRANLLGVLIMAVIFIALNVAFKAYFGRGPDGYISLVPTLFLLFLISIYMFFAKNPSFANFACASLVAVIALFFRIIDMEVCPYFPHGTHFLWHSLMALFFFLMVREVIRKHRDV
jgi:hypothetical protein